VRPCPLCAGEEARVIYQLSGRAVLRCPRCRLLYSSRPTSTDESRSFYESEEFWAGPLVRGWSADFDERSPEVQLFRRALRALTRARPGRAPVSHGERVREYPGRILDLGCSSGLFLELARREGWQAQGVELSERAAQAAKENFGLDVFCGTLAEARFPDASFDAVTLWDVIEHFDNPRADLVEVARVTRLGGILVISTPNCASLFHAVGHLIHRLSFGRACGLLQLLYPDKHNTYFSPPTLAAMLREVGFRVVARAGFAAHPARWLRVRVSPVLRAASSALDLASDVLGGQYRMLLFARRVSR